jgi:rSAM/selenodomain-associated transferase 2
MPRLSIIIPTLNEGTRITSALDALVELRWFGVEIIVVDGGSGDATIQRARMRADHVIRARRGRATQMNAGAAIATGEILLFLHADTKLPPEAERVIFDSLAHAPHEWGRFDVAIEGNHPMFRIIATTMNLRSRISGIATGDQAIFVKRDVFHAVGGFPEIPLMEDIALSKALKRRSRPLCIPDRVVTSGRRWETNGIARTIVLMWRLRLAYSLGADPARLARQYGYGG